jgi:hypothetical protein
MVMMMHGNMQDKMPVPRNVLPPHIPPMRFAEGEGNEDERTIEKTESKMTINVCFELSVIYF